MSLIPTFEIGLWNAWILVLGKLLPMLFFLRIYRARGALSPDLSTMRRTLARISTTLTILAVIYCVFLPLKLGAVWFYVGLPITLIGFIGGTTALVSWHTASRDESVTTGLYRFSRHPMYITDFLFFLGVAIATASWVLLLVGIIYTIAAYASIDAEEQSYTEKYGNAYRKYMERTPRLIVVPK